MEVTTLDHPTFTISLKCALTEDFDYELIYNGVGDVCLLTLCCTGDGYKLSTDDGMIGAKQDARSQIIEEAG